MPTYFDNTKVVKQMFDFINICFLWGFFRINLYNDQDDVMPPPPPLVGHPNHNLTYILSLPGNFTLFSISLRLRPCYLRIKQLNCSVFFRSAKCLHEKKCCYHYKEVVNYGSNHEYEALRAKRVGTV